MSKKKILIICIFLLFIILIVILFLNKKKLNNNVKESFIINNEIKVYRDDKLDVYYLKDEITGEIVCVTTDEETLQFYKENPDYNPNPLSSPITDLNSYIYSEYEFNNEIEY